MKIFPNRNRKKTKKGQVQSTGRLLSQISRRIWLLLILLIGLFVFLAVRFFLQATSNTDDSLRSALNQFNYNTSVEVARPGDILDANMTTLATSYYVYILFLDPKNIYETERMYPGSLEKTIEVVSGCFGLDADALRKGLEENRNLNYYRFGKTKVEEEQRAEFYRIQAKINGTAKADPEAETGEDGGAEPAAEEKKKLRVIGVYFEPEARRIYPYGTVASKLIGFRTIDTLQGLWGLEKYYDNELKGINGRQYGYMNENADLERDVVTRKNGDTLVTTLDVNLEMMIARELEEWYAETDENGNLVNSAKSVNILAMDPNSGAIKAFVSDSDYDINRPTDLSGLYTEEQIAFFRQNQEDYEDAENRAAESGTELEWDMEAFPTEDQKLNEMWRNSLISNSYEPGSTGKVMTYAAAIEENVISEDTPYFCDGAIQVANYSIKCHNYPLGGCGAIDAVQAVANSCNVAFIQIGQALGRTAFAKYQQIFNFGQKTGVDLPGEASCEGLLYNESQLNDVELATNAFGQCYNVTMLQLASAFCSTINGGYYYRPYVVSRILDSSGATVKAVEPVVLRQTVSEATSRKVRDALRATVASETGTGGSIQYADGEELRGYSFIAKTGTAEKLPRSAKKYLVSVISAVPQEHPELVLYVTIDEYGGALQADSMPAQKLTGNIWGSILDYIGVYSEYGQGVDQYRYNTEPADEAWQNGEAIMEGENGSPGPLPPADDGSGMYNGLIINPENVINPNDALPDMPVLFSE